MRSYCCECISSIYSQFSELYSLSSEGLFSLALVSLLDTLCVCHLCLRRTEALRQVEH